MEKKIKNTINIIIIGFVCFWSISLFTFILGECNVLPIGLFADNFKNTYIFNTITILVAVIFIPTSLKLYKTILQHQIAKLTILLALKRYLILNYIRLLMLLIVSLLGLFDYYLTLSNTGILCTLMGICASFFCIPSIERIRKEMHIDEY